MSRGGTQHVLLSPKQIDHLRSRLRDEREAHLIAPQLLEQVALLTRELREALAALEGLRAAALNLAAVQERLAPVSTHCPACNHPRVREAWSKLSALLRDEENS